MESYPSSELRQARIYRDEARLFFWTTFLVGIIVIVAVAAVHWSIMQMLSFATTQPISTTVITHCAEPKQSS